MGSLLEIGFIFLFMYLSLSFVCFTTKGSTKMELNYDEYKFETTTKIDDKLLYSFTHQDDEEKKDLPRVYDPEELF